MGIAAVLKNQRHKQMEHFGVLFIVLTVCFVTVCILCGVYQNADDKARDEAQAVYTRSFLTSRSNVKGTVVGICTDEAHKHCVVFMKLANMDTMPINASLYRGYLAVASSDGKSQYALEDDVSGSIYVYGRSGYIAVYLSNPNGFDGKHLYLMMENTRPMASGSTTSNNSSSDAQSTKADTWSVIFNAGASGTYKVDSLAADKFDAQDFYAQTLLVAQEKKCKAQANADLQLLSDDMRTLIEWRDRCSDMGIDMTNALPPDVKGDSIKAAEGTGDLVLNTEYNSPGAISVDWRNTDIKKGYLPDNVDISSVSALSDYILKQATAAKTTEFDKLTDYTWKTTSGEKIELNDTNANTVRADQIVNLKSFITAVDTYRADKSRYQVDDMLAFVSLDLDYSQIGRTMTVNTGTADKPAVARVQ